MSRFFAVMPGPASALRARLEDQLWLTPFRMAGAEDSAVLNKARRMHARGRGRALFCRGPAPKEQPPRKLSGKRTAGGRALWKAAGRS